MKMKRNIKMSNNWITLMLFGLLTSQITEALNIAKVTTTTATERSQLVEDVRPGATPSSSVPLDVKGKQIENDLHFTTITSHESVEAKPFISSSSTEASIPSTPLENRFAETQTPTLASSNAPATTIVNESEKPTTTTKTLEKLTPTMDQPSEIAAERKDPTNKESLESSDASVVDGAKGQQQIMTMTEQQTIINNKELQQQTEQQHQEHQSYKEQQTLTTEVSMLKETEVQQQQVNGNAQTTTANIPNNVITLKVTATDNKEEEDERVEKKPKHEDMKKLATTTATNIPFTTIHAAEDATEIATDSQQFKIDTSISGNFQATSIPQQQQGIVNGDISSSSSTNLDEESRRILSSTSVDLDEKKSEPSSNTPDLNKESRGSPSSSAANSDEKTGSPTSNWEILDEKQKSSNLEILDVQTSNPTSTPSSSSSPSPGIEENEKLHIFEEKSTIRPQTPHTSSTTSHTDDDMKSSSPISPPSTGIEESEKLHIFEEAITSRPLPPHPDNHEFPTNSEQLALNDFKPLIQETNNKLLAERTIYTPKNLNEEQEWKQNLMPNEVEDFEHPVGPKLRMEPKKVYQSPYEHNINWSPYLHPATPVAVDFTGKVLQEEDGVITEIEEKFRLKEFATDINGKQEENEETTTAKAAEPVATPTHKPFATLMVNHEKSPPNTHRSKEVNAGGPTPNVVIMRPVQFIERRVKKSFDFPMHRIASDANHAMQHFDFANTKFSSNLNEPKQHLNPPLAQELSATSGVGSGISQGAPSHDLNAMHVPRQQPEFSTTKFYNSKELYNEMLQHKNKQMQQQQQQQPSDSHSHPDSMNMLKEDDITPQAGRGASSMTLNSFAVLHSPKIAKLEEIHEQPQKSLAIKRVTVQQHQHNKSDSLETPPTTMSTNIGSTTTRINAELLTATTTSTTTKKFHKELKKAKLLIKTIIPNNNNNNNGEGDGSQRTETYKSSTVTPDHKTNTGTAAQSASPTTTSTQLLTTNPTTLTSSKPQEARSNNLTSSALPSDAGDAASSQIIAPSSTSGKSYSSTSSATPPASSSDPQSYMVPSYVYPPPTWRPTSSASSHSTNPTKSATKPIVRPRILSRLQEKINSLECEIPNVPQDSHLWRGNETHELLLPIMTPENCKTDKDCTAMMVSWEGEAEIQSGDILIVEINDALLNPKEINLTTSAHNTQVYQVTRSGHEHCDVTEGILLDITPLIVDGRKLVTLYDKDLTEGVNLLIVVSELWGSQCVRLKVTTKTENCGEGADCSGKGVCYSNSDMEEYECQCCSGFAGPHCEEIDACTPSPCTNNGICVDLSQGHEGNSYQCLCPYGYTGKNCQYELDPCNPAECMNGGSCVGNSTHFRCECAPGYTGPLCQHILNECESSPCIHGICVDQEDGFRCFCQPGFAGELCNFEYNECESNPCQNGGECIDHIGSYECRCSKGYTGTRCHIKVDFCANKPCPEGRRCIDHGNDYSCECLGGRNGPDCNEMLRTQCNVNPCTHGGTCWSSGDSFYCACRPGYTGTMCEDEFVVETVVSSSEFMVDDTSARNFNDKSFGSSVVLKSPIELHNAYTAAIVLALVIFFVALYLTICHCKVNQTYRKFSTRTYGFLPILGFRWRTKQATSKISRHWLSGKGLGGGGATGANAMRVASNSTLSAPLQRNSVGHLPTANASTAGATAASSSTGQQQQQQRHHHVGQLNERPFQRHLAMNLENDMYYTVDFSENSQHSPLIQ